MTDGCCTPFEGDPTPEHDRTATIVLGVIVTVSVLILGGIAYLIL